MRGLMCSINSSSICLMFPLKFGLVATWRPVKYLHQFPSINCPHDIKNMSSTCSTTMCLNQVEPHISPSNNCALNHKLVLVGGVLKTPGLAKSDSVHTGNGRHLKQLCAMFILDSYTPGWGRRKFVISEKQLTSPFLKALNKIEFQT